ncbi:MAG: acetyl-coenzyme A carboxylase carboxyl transferase subunit beta [Cellvibrionales bacterium]|nr:MAG: acetyl-coenzyme A carboxylase carboxyl transferase subunit beta [Cellvibrionales bacterium]
MSWIDKILPSGVNKDENATRASVPEGLWKKCVKCDAILYKPDLERNAEVCPKCNHHMRIGARRRLELCLDRDATELFSELEPVDHLKFKDKRKYRDRLTAAQRSTGEKDALIAMRGGILGVPVVALAFEFDFHGGSMGYAVGEKFSRAATVALEEGLPLICFSASGGARMQEALISLMQMAKTSAVIERLKGQGFPYISVLTDPIYGGVSASLRCWATSISPSPTPALVSPGPTSLSKRFVKNCPKVFSAASFFLNMARSI